MKRGRIVIICALFLGLLCSRALAREEEPVGVLRTAPRSLLQEEPFVRSCQLGSAAADAVRVLAGTDIALVNAGDLVNDLNAGTVRREDVRNVFASDQPLGTARLTAAQLRTLLEHAVARVTVDPVTEKIDGEESRFEGFCQVSGFRFQYDASAPPGERVLQIVDEDGDPLPDTVTVCAAVCMLEGGYGFDPVPFEPLDATLADALEAYLREYTVFPSLDKERITVIGVRIPMLGTGITRGVLFAGSAVLIGFLAYYRMRRRSYQEEYSETEDSESLTKAQFYRGRGRRR